MMGWRFGEKFIEKREIDAHGLRPSGALQDAEIDDLLLSNDFWIAFVRLHEAVEQVAARRLFAGGAQLCGNPLKWLMLLGKRHKWHGNLNDPQAAEP
jgi:hypothetical protein